MPSNQELGAVEESVTKEEILNTSYFVILQRVQLQSSRLNTGLEM